MRENATVATSVGRDHRVRRTILVADIVKSPAVLTKSHTSIGKFDILCRGEKSVKITPSRINTLLTIGENLNIEFKRAGDGPKADTFESVCAFLNKAGGDLQLGVDDDFVMVMPRPQSSVKSSIRSSVKSVDKTVDWTVDKTVDKTVDWTVDKTADGSTNERILNLLVTNPRATQEELARVLGLSVRGIEYAIGTLKKAKRIRKVGGKRFGHWEVIG